MLETGVRLPFSVFFFFDSFSIVKTSIDPFSVSFEGIERLLMCIGFVKAKKALFFFLKVKIEGGWFDGKGSGT